MERPTDETLWAQYAAGALAHGDAVQIAATEADAMLTEHRKRFPAAKTLDQIADDAAAKHPNKIVDQCRYIRALTNLGLAEAKAAAEAAQARSALR
jgi:ribosomal protein L7/L12